VISLRILRNEVKEVKKGSECGILLEPNFVVEEGDDVVSYKIEKY
jgi:translation initiation factor IF-2